MATNFVAKLSTPCTYNSSIPKQNVRINSVNDAYILCKNFVYFAPVTQRKRGSFVNFLYNMAKNWHM